MIPRQQYATSGHSLEVLDHVFAHADVGTDEEANAIEGIAIVFTRIGARNDQILNFCQLIEQRLALAIGAAFGAANEGQFDISLPPQKIGRASCREECVSTCRSRWSTYH